MLISCTHCGQKLKVPDSLAGKKVRCSGCSSVTIAPDTAAGKPAKPRAEKTGQPADAFDDEDDDRPRSRRSRDDEEDEDEPRDRRRSARRRDEDDDEEVRPRSRRSREDDDEDDDYRPRSRRSRDDEDDDYDDRRRGGKKKKGNMQAERDFAALFLMGAAGGLAVYIFLNAFYTYMWWKALEDGFDLIGIQVRISIISPVSQMIWALVLGLIFYGPCSVLMFIGASKLRGRRDYNLALTGAIVATVISSWMIIVFLNELGNMPGMRLTIFQPLQALFTAALTGVSGFGGIRSLIILNEQGVKKHFNVKSSRRR